MEKLQLHLTKKTAGIACAAVGATLLIGMGGCYAAGQIAQNNSIDAAAAQSFAFVDAGVMPENAQVIKSKFDYDDGVFYYDVEFVADGVYYDYDIKAADGTVLKKDVEGVKGYQASQVTQPGSGSTQAPAPQQPQPAPQQPQPAPQQPAPQQGNLITVDEAKNIALSHAGVGSGATFVKTELDHDDGRMVYEIEFYVDWTEYNVDVDAVSGTVVGFDIDYEDYD